MRQGFEINGRVVIAECNKYVAVGQPPIDPSISKWVIGCEKHENETGNDFINALNHDIREWLRNNAVERKVILLGGLGKSLASLLLSLILIEANKLKIDTCVACTLPMGFEEKNKIELAQRSLAVLKEVSSSLYYHDNNAIKEYFSNRYTPLKENFDLVSYSIAIALNDWFGNYERKGVNKILISKKDGIRTIEKQIGTYGWFEISIGGL